MDKTRIIIILIILVVSTLTDLSKGKIYNIITIPSAILGILLSFLLPLSDLSVKESVFHSIGGLIIPIIIFWIPFKLEWFAAGDVKLMAAIGTFSGYKFIINAIIYSFAWGFVTAIIVMIFRGIFFSKIKEMMQSLLLFNFDFGKISDVDKKSIYPYAANFLLGTATLICLGVNYWIFH